MPGKTRKSVSKLLGIWTFFLFFLLQEAFPKATFAFTSLNACARSKACLKLIKDSSSAAVSAPTGAGVKASTLSTTNSTGTLTVSLQAVTDLAIVTGPTATRIAWHYWSQAQNEQAQTRSMARYCAVYPADTQLCALPFTGGQEVGVRYIIEAVVYQKSTNRPVYSSSPFFLKNLPGRINQVGIRQTPFPNFGYVSFNGGWEGVQGYGGTPNDIEYRNIVVRRADGLPDKGVNPPSVSVKN